jgi:hypothetical protein
MTAGALKLAATIQSEYVETNKRAGVMNVSHLQKSDVFLTGTKAFKRRAELLTTPMATEAQIRKLLGHGVNKKVARKLTYDQAQRTIHKIAQETKRAANTERKRLAQRPAMKQIKRLWILGVPPWKADKLTTVAEVEAMIKKHESLPPLPQQLEGLKALGILDKPSSRGEAANLIESHSGRRKTRDRRG